VTSRKADAEARQLTIALSTLGEKFFASSPKRRRRRAERHAIVRRM
jgi:hypothetical protein